jgi:HSP20 family protein
LKRRRIEKKTQSEAVRHELMRGAPHFRPQVDILEVGDELRVLADLPGAKADDIEINFENGVLTIYGRVEPRQDESTAYLIREYGVGSFYRVFEVSENIDAERISAEYSDGVLELHLPKAERAKARKIEVQAR